ncbi:hypothetical protein [Flavobacterium sp.]|uniref:hypothetical protein n=1 Tax=Flavobacterium sp. TaxID=239 RepID=UPI00286E3B37|nr:hypothetical protein [Flavobacterium sp.]
MKKFILSAAILLGSFTAFAQDAKTAKAESAKQETQEKFKEVKVEELPEAVKTALKAGYPDATVTKAYINDKKEYKMDIAVGDQKGTVHTDASGNWLKK